MKTIWLNYSHIIILINDQINTKKKRENNNEKVIVEFNIYFSPLLFFSLLLS